MIESFIIDQQLRGAQLLDCLSHRWPDADRAFLRRAVVDGQVKVNAMVVRGSKRVGPGDIVTLDFAASDIPRHADPLAVVDPVILAESDDVLVIDKPSGLPSVPDRAGKYAGALGAVRAIRPDEDLRAIHRLDAGTSGCLAFAKGLDAARHFDRVFREREAHKIYDALVDGVMRRDGFESKRALGPDTRRPGKIRVVPEGSKGSRDAHTIVERVEQFRRHALVRVTPRTGRSHQIRVHLAAAGHGIVGDRDYGRSGQLLLSEIKRDYKIRTGVAEKPILTRTFLHARELTLPLPSGESLCAEAGLPAALSWC